MRKIFLLILIIFSLTVFSSCADKTEVENPETVMEAEIDEKDVFYEFALSDLRDMIFWDSDNSYVYGNIFCAKLLDLYENGELRFVVGYENWAGVRYASVFMCDKKGNVVCVNDSLGSDKVSEYANAVYRDYGYNFDLHSVVPTDKIVANAFLTEYDYKKFVKYKGEWTGNSENSQSVIEITGVDVEAGTVSVNAKSKSSDGQNSVAAESLVLDIFDNMAVGNYEDVYGSKGHIAIYFNEDGIEVGSYEIYSSDSANWRLYLNDKTYSNADFDENSGDIKIVVNGEEIDCGEEKPFTDNGRTFLPLRAVSDAIGAELYYDYSDGVQLITAVKGSTLISFADGIINDKDVYFDGVWRLKRQEISRTEYPAIFIDNTEGVAMNPTPLMLDNRLFVPIRVIAEIFGAEVDWKNDEKKVVINIANPEFERTEELRYLSEGFNFSKATEMYGSYSESDNEGRYKFPLYNRKGRVFSIYDSIEKAEIYIYADGTVKKFR